MNEFVLTETPSFLIIAALPCIVMYCDVKFWCTFDVNDVQTPSFFWSIRPLFVRKKPLFTFDHLVCFFQISLDILDIFASFDPAVWIYRLCDGPCTKCYDGLHFFQNSTTANYYHVSYSITVLVLPSDLHIHHIIRCHSCLFDVHSM